MTVTPLATATEPAIKTPEISVIPAPTPVTNPELFTVATAVEPLVHLHEVVTSRVLPSANVASALS